jgi:hypothetical protein
VTLGVFPCPTCLVLAIDKHRARPPWTWRHLQRANSRPGPVSWPASPGLRPRCPFIRVVPVRPLPVGVATSLRCAGSTRCTSRSVLVDSHHLDGLLRSGLRACCIPVRKGFAAFPGPALGVPASRTRESTLQAHRATS